MKFNFSSQRDALVVIIREREREVLPLMNGLQPFFFSHPEEHFCRRRDTFFVPGTLSLTKMGANTRSERRRHKVSERDGEILSYLIALRYEIKIQVMPFCCTTITLFYFFFALSP
jgi:hypothetical protein